MTTSRIEHSPKFWSICAAEEIPDKFWSNPFSFGLIAFYAYHLTLQLKKRNNRLTHLGNLFLSLQRHGECWNLKINIFIYIYIYINTYLNITSPKQYPAHSCNRFSISVPCNSDEGKQNCQEEGASCNVWLDGYVIEVSLASTRRNLSHYKVL